MTKTWIVVLAPAASVTVVCATLKFGVQPGDGWETSTYTPIVSMWLLSLATTMLALSECNSPGESRTFFGTPLMRVRRASWPATGLAVAVGVAVGVAEAVGVAVGVGVTEGGGVGVPGVGVGVAGPGVDVLLNVQLKLDTLGPFWAELGGMNTNVADSPGSTQATPQSTSTTLDAIEYVGDGQPGAFCTNPTEIAGLDVTKTMCRSLAVCPVSFTNVLAQGGDWPSMKAPSRDQ
jgi:hypothetical protein